ncbi:unnamed protein product [Meloidogyne enterolobii]|uniref:Uncharacterized protein n=1 Tax=Meloidogyne enterolobii TaxID=390850 RepID=A0ACB0YZW2_MELEN
MDKKIINWIASTQQSFLVINHITTHHIFNFSNTLSKLHDESYYRKHALPSAYLLVKNKIKKELEDCPKLSFTTDIWSNGIESFIRLFYFQFFT